MAHFTRSFPLLLVMFLAACSGTVSYSEVQRPGVPGKFAAAAGGRDMLVSVVGNPFGVPQAEFAAAVVAGMQGHNTGPRTNFTTTPNETARPDWRIVMYFDPPINFHVLHACKDPAQLRSESGGERITVQAAFCKQDQVESNARVQIPRVEDVNAPEFQALLARATRELIPRTDPTRDDSTSGSCVLMPC